VPRVEYSAWIFSLKIFALSDAKELAGTAVDTERYCRGFKKVMMPTVSNDNIITASIRFHHPAIRSIISGIESFFNGGFSHLNNFIFAAYKYTAAYAK
jgi:hypothetical protein